MLGTPAHRRSGYRSNRRPPCPMLRTRTVSCTQSLVLGHIPIATFLEVHTAVILLVRRPAFDKILKARVTIVSGNGRTLNTVSFAARVMMRAAPCGNPCSRLAAWSSSRKNILTKLTKLPPTHMLHVPASHAHPFQSSIGWSCTHSRIPAALGGQFSMQK